MQTHFSDDQLANPAIAEANRVLRTCVHCGFCLATCPTYVLLGDELDSPRGRIYLMKEMLEGGAPPVAETVKHIDRCLSCLSCMSTCPAGVDYMRLVDQTRVHIETSYRRSWQDRWLRRFLGWILIRPLALRFAMSAGKSGSDLRRFAARAIGGAGAHVTGHRWRALTLYFGWQPSPGGEAAPARGPADRMRSGRDRH